jgi:hypothetical protein
MSSSQNASVDSQVRQAIQEHQAFYEVLPYYVLFEERPAGGCVTTQRIQAGFDIDIYGVRRHPGSQGSTHYGLFYRTLQEVTAKILPHTSETCSLEVLPFQASTIFDTKMHLQPEAMIRIRITHYRGLDKPAGPPEEHALHEIEEQLKKLGVKLGGQGHY